MIVLDASAAVLGLLNDGEVRRMLRDNAVVCPHLTDSEVVDALRALVLRGDLDASVAGRAIEAWSSLGLSRFAVHGLLGRVWELRENLGAWHASAGTLSSSPTRRSRCFHWEDPGSLLPVEGTVDDVGRIVVPKPVRDRLRLAPGTKVDVSEYGDGLHIAPAGRTARLESRGGDAGHR